MSEHAKTPTPWFNDQVYDAAKFVAQIGLPALGTLYAAIAGLWGVPFAEQVVGTIIAVDAFLGVLLGISSAQFNAVGGQHDGAMNVITRPDGSQVYSLEVHKLPETLAAKDAVSFKVVHQDEQISSTPGDLPPVAPPVG